MVNYDGLYNKNFYGDKIGQNHLSEQKLSFRILKNATILPHKSIPNHPTGLGGIVDADGNFLEETFVHHGITETYTPEEEIMYIDKSVIYLDMICHVWGHCLTDSLRRTWFFHSDFYKKDFKNLPIVYVPMLKGIVPSFAEILRILEIEPDNLIAITQPTKFKEIILPDESFFEITDRQTQEQTVFFTKEYQETIQRIKNYGEKNLSSLSQKKFYFYYGFNDVGEKRLSRYFEEKDYQVIRPEKLTFKEQLNILTNCENFASTLGSISHNTIFMKEGMEAIYIPRYPSYNVYQLALDTLQDLNIYYIDSSISVCYLDYRGPYCYIISDHLKKFFDDDWIGHYSDADYIAVLFYMKISADAKFWKGKNVDEYYLNALANFFTQLESRKDLMEKVKESEV